MTYFKSSSVSTRICNCRGGLFGPACEWAPKRGMEEPQIMGREDVDQLPVTSNGRVEGIVTRRLCLKYGGRVRRVRP